MAGSTVIGRCRRCQRIFIEYEYDDTIPDYLCVGCYLDLVIGDKDRNDLVIEMIGRAPVSGEPLYRYWDGTDE